MTVHQTLRLCGQRVRLDYGGWQIVFANEKLYFTRDVPELAAKSAPKSAKPRAEPSAKSAANQGSSQACSQVCGWRAHFSAPPCRACAAFRSQALMPEKVAHSACLSADVNTHPNKQFPGHLVDHMPSCLHVLFPVPRPLCFPPGGGGEGIRHPGNQPWGPAAQHRCSFAPRGSRAQWATAGACAEQGTWGSRTRKHREAGCGRPEDGGVWTAKTVKRTPQQPTQPQYANY